MWTEYIEIFVNAYQNTASYLWRTIITPFPEGKINGFYFLIFISIGIWLLEIKNPWRKKQPVFRKDFWLDAFYMFFNFYIFSLLIYAALSNVTLKIVNDLLLPLGYQGGHLIDLSNVHWAIQLILFFIISDFIQWGIHNLLHRVPFLWHFHKLHHSVKEMGFAAHLRYHFFETFVYQSIKYISLSMIFGFELQLAFIIYSFTVFIGHLNHANLKLDYGPLRYILNNPKMHIWHHAKELPESHPKGMNFGITLSCWDYIFRTKYIPSDGRDIELGFPGDEDYPDTFVKQAVEPFRVKK